MPSARRTTERVPSQPMTARARISRSPAWSRTRTPATRSPSRTRPAATPCCTRTLGQRSAQAYSTASTRSCGTAIVLPAGPSPRTGAGWRAMMPRGACVTTSSRRASAPSACSTASTPHSSRIASVGGWSRSPRAPCRSRSSFSTMTVGTPREPSAFASAAPATAPPAMTTCSISRLRGGAPVQRAKRACEETCSRLVDALLAGEPLVARPELLTHDARAVGQRAQLAARGVTREVLHAAIGREHQPLGRDVPQGGADALGHGLGRFDLARAEIDHAEHDRLVSQTLQHREVKPWLRGLDRELVDGQRRQRLEELVAAGLVLDVLRVPEAAVDDRR